MTHKHLLVAIVLVARCSKPKSVPNISCQEADVRDCASTATNPRTIAAAPVYIPVEWEHGWKTSVVIATRYENDIVGYNIGFQFPQDLNNGDRAELFEFIEHELHGTIYEGGGYPGAELLTIFPDVKDKASANRKLKEVLPDLSKFIVALRRL